MIANIPKDISKAIDLCNLRIGHTISDNLVGKISDTDSCQREKEINELYNIINTHYSSSNTQITPYMKQMLVEPIKDGSLNSSLKMELMMSGEYILISYNNQNFKNPDVKDSWEKKKPINGVNASNIYGFSDRIFVDNIGEKLYIRIPLDNLRYADNTFSD